MGFEVNFSDRAARELKKPDKQTQRRIIEKLTQHAATENLSEVKKLTNPLLGEWRYRIGDYRVIFDLSGNEIQVLKVAHRSEVYD